MALHHTLAVVSNIKANSRRGRLSENITGERPQRGPTSGLGSIFTCPDILKETITDRHKFEPQHDLIEPTCCQIRRQTVNCRVVSSKRLSPTGPWTVRSLSSRRKPTSQHIEIEKKNPIRRCSQCRLEDAHVKFNNNFLVRRLPFVPETQEAESSHRVPRQLHAVSPQSNAGRTASDLCVMVRVSRGCVGRGRRVGFDPPAFHVRDELVGDLR